MQGLLCSLLLCLSMYSLPGVFPIFGWAHTISVNTAAPQSCWRKLYIWIITYRSCIGCLKHCLIVSIHENRGMNEVRSAWIRLTSNSACLILICALNLLDTVSHKVSCHVCVGMQSLRIMHTVHKMKSAILYTHKIRQSLFPNDLKPCSFQLQSAGTSHTGKTRHKLSLQMFTLIKHTDYKDGGYSAGGLWAQVSSKESRRDVSGFGTGIHCPSSSKFLGKGNRHPTLPLALIWENQGTYENSGPHKNHLSLQLGQECICELIVRHLCPVRVKMQWPYRPAPFS